MSQVTARVKSPSGAIVGYYYDYDVETVVSLEKFRSDLADGSVLYPDLDALPDIVLGEVAPDVDTSCVHLCRTLRRLAICRTLTVDTSTHASPENTHLFEYIHYCGYPSVEDYVRKYLETVQPFMLRRLGQQEKVETFRCVLDTLYAVDLYIKVDTRKGEEVVISFHESHKNGIAKTNRRVISKSNQRVAVLPMQAIEQDNGEYLLKIQIMRGMAYYTITSMGRRLTDCYSAEYADIQTAILRTVNEGLYQILGSDFIFTDLHQLSFTSFSKDPVSVISALIDVILQVNTEEERRMANGFLSGYVCELELGDRELQDIKRVLDSRFRVSSAKIIPTLLHGVYGLLDSRMVGCKDEKRRLLNE